RAHGDGTVVRRRAVGEPPLELRPGCPRVEAAHAEALLTRTPPRVATGRPRGRGGRRHRPRRAPGGARDAGGARAPTSRSRPATATSGRRSGGCPTRGSAG